MLAVDADDDDTREKVSAYREKLKLSHPMLLKGWDASAPYDLMGVMPTAFWIDHKGLVVHRESGFESGLVKEIERRIVELLDRRDREAPPSKPARDTVDPGR